MGEVWVVRHAPTAHNREQRFQGQSDVEALPLDGVEPLPPAPRAIHCSPLSRARVAAAALFPGEPVHLDPLLLERSVGAWEGLDHATVLASWPDAFVDGHLSPVLDPPDGESVFELLRRVRRFLVERDETDDVYAVTHNGWIRGALVLTGAVPAMEIFSESVPFLTPVRLEMDGLRSPESVWPHRR